MYKKLKKVKDCTVEDLIAIGRQDGVKNLQIIINDSLNQEALYQPSHFDIQICGAFYSRKLCLDDEVEIQVDEKVVCLNYALLYLEHHSCGKVLFVDKNNETVQKIDVLETSNISTKFYNYRVNYKSLLPSDNPYLDETVSVIQFIDLDKEQMLRIKNK